jgi:hypothetical protein
VKKSTFFQKKISRNTYMLVNFLTNQLGYWGGGVLGEWLHGCMDAWLHECMGAWVKDLIINCQLLIVNY